MIRVMPHIASIESSKRDPNRLTVKVDGRSVAALSQRSVTALGLEVGQAWDEATAAAVLNASRIDTAVAEGLRRLSRRPMSRRKLLTKLIESGHDELSCKAAIDRLIELDTVNDERLGRQLIQEILGRGAAGPSLLRDKLRRALLEEELVESLITESVNDQVSEIDSAMRLAKERLKGWSSQSLATKRRRLASLLNRRGFDSDTVEEVLTSLTPEPDLDDLA